MNVVQYSWPRSKYNFGIKQYTSELASRLPVTSVYLRSHSNRMIMPELLIKCIRHNADVNHFTDQWLSFMGYLHPKNSVLSIMDTITEKYYDASIFGSTYYNNFDVITTISDYSKQDIIDTYNVDNDVVVIPCGVNTDVFYSTV